MEKIAKLADEKFLMAVRTKIQSNSLNRNDNVGYGSHNTSLRSFDTQDKSSKSMCFQIKTYSS